MKTLKVLMLFITAVCMLVSCKKTEVEWIPQLKVLEIDLTSAANRALNVVGGSVVFSEEGIIVAKLSSDESSSIFVAAKCSCPCCGMTLCFNADEGWGCDCCKTKYDACGGWGYWGLTNMCLQVYPVTQSGNILTITY